MHHLKAFPNTVLLTGATGYLGSNLLKMLLIEGYNVIVLKRSASDISRITPYLSKCKFYDIDITPIKNIFFENEIDIVLHTAASYGRKEGENIQTVIDANLFFSVDVLTNAIESGVKRWINTDTSLSKYTNAYTLSKKQFCEWLTYHENSIKVQNVVLEYFYGPGDDSWKLVTMILTQLHKKVPFIDFTSGEQRRDFIFIDDVVNAYQFILQDSSADYGKVFSYPVGTGNSISIKDLAINAKKISGNINSELRFGTLPDRPTDLIHSSCDISILQQKGWKPNVDLQDGLAKTFDFISQTN